jgi:signal transduction histidine kinase
MVMDGKKGSPEREQTDESLRVERQKTDHALTKRLETVDQEADAIVRRAREGADAVLVAARDKADRLLTQTSPPAPPATIALERAHEDQTLRDERASQDERLRREREDDARALAKLLPLERHKTDRYLLTERARSDNAVSHRDDFLGIASHDLRNLLSGIVLNATQLSRDAPDDEAGRKLLARTNSIHRYAARMNRLVGDLVDITSIDAGKLAVTASPGDSNALVAEAVETFLATASEKGISLQAEMSGHPVPAKFDHDRMLQVLANLITNAIKFTPAGGQIAVQGKRVGDELRFCVSDTGPGIPADMLDAIFERFWQAGKNDRRGLGLGLYISKCLIEAHGGRIWAESVLGEGTRVCFTLPASGRPPASRISA